MSTSDKGSRAGKDGVAEQLGEDAAEWREMRLGIAESSVSQGQAVTFESMENPLECLHSGSCSSVLLLKDKTGTREVRVGSGRPCRRLEEQPRPDVMVVIRDNGCVVAER